MRSFFLNSLFCSVLFVFCLCTPAAAQDAKSDAAQRKADEQKLQEYFRKNKIHPQKGPVGIYYTITKEGTGRPILAGQTVTIDYTGKLLDGTVFDSNTDPKFQHPESMIVEIGTGRVIRGWDKGIQLLKKGSVATLYIPSGMAYGPVGNRRIPANSVLVFDVEVVDVTK